jgi:hypothetical protein
MLHAITPFLLIGRLCERKVKRETRDEKAEKRFTFFHTGYQIGLKSKSNNLKIDKQLRLTKFGLLSFIQTTTICILSN